MGSRRPKPASRSGGGRAVRHRAVRPLVVRGTRLPRRRLSGARGAAQPRTPRHCLATSRRPSHPRRGADCRRAPGAPTATSACGSIRGRPGPGSASGRWRSASGTSAPAALDERVRARPSWPRRPASCCWLSRPTGSSSSRPAPRPTTPSSGFQEHCAAAEQLVSALGAGGELLETARARAAELAYRDAIFPEILPAVSAALGGSRSFVLG